MAYNNKKINSEKLFRKKMLRNGNEEIITIGT